MKDEGINLAIMTIKFVISCDALILPIHFDDACFGHVMSKVTQYAINDDKISKELMLKYEIYTNGFPILHHMAQEWVC
jgi:hypothetical protein